MKKFKFNRLEGALGSDCPEALRTYDGNVAIILSNHEEYFQARELLEILSLEILNNKSNQK